jgi:hypothetical protein
MLALEKSTVIAQLAVAVETGQNEKRREIGRCQIEMNGAVF